MKKGKTYATHVVPKENAFSVSRGRSYKQPFRLDANFLRFHAFCLSPTETETEEDKARKKRKRRLVYVSSYRESRNFGMRSKCRRQLLYPVAAFSRLLPRADTIAQRGLSRTSRIRSVYVSNIGYYADPKSWQAPESRDLRREQR